MERAARDSAMQANPAAIPNRSNSTPVPNMPDAAGIVPNTSGNPSGARAPALPPPLDIPAAKPPAPRSEGGAVRMRNDPRPPGLIGAQN
jgi:hypothetical protein